MTDFLYDDGGGDGYITSPFDLLSTELNSLANNNTAVSSVGGSSGVFSQSHTGGAILADIWLYFGSTIAVGAGGTVYGWFLRSLDNGTTFEKVVTNSMLQRGPDFIIPFINTNYAVGEPALVSGAPVIIPAGKFKTFVYSQLGVAMHSSGNHLVIAPIAVTDR